LKKYPHILSVLLITLVFITSCKSTKRIASGEANLDLSAKQLIKENAKQSPEFKTLQAKLKISYASGDNEQTHSVTFRMKKDEVIWINSAFSVIRARITPEKVSFYNKLDNTYFDGDYKYLSDLLGTTLDFDKVQNLLLGEPIFRLNEDDYSASIMDDLYVLQPKNQHQLFEIFYLISPSHFKVKSQQISQPKSYRHLQIDYLNYQDVDKQVLPENIKIIAVEADEEMIAKLEFKSVSLNEDLNFPFNIPSGFEEIKLK
jgi:outer membrane biogenesis lipoprotein LolB